MPDFDILQEMNSYLPKKGAESPGIEIDGPAPEEKNLPAEDSEQNNNSSPDIASEMTDFLQKYKSGKISKEEDKKPTQSATKDSSSEKKKEETNNSSYQKALRVIDLVGAEGLRGLTGLVNPKAAAEFGDYLGYLAAKGVRSLAGKETPAYKSGVEESALLRNLPDTTKMAEGAIESLSGIPLPKPGMKGGMSSADPIQPIDTWIGKIDPEKLLGTTTQFLTGGVASGMRKVPAALSGLASEVAGQTTEGSSLEIPARIAGAILGAKSGEKIAQPVVKFESTLTEGKQIKATEQQAKEAVGDVLQQASNKEKAVANIMKNNELLQGVSPTIGEAAKDIGLARYQKGLATTYQEPFNALAMAKEGKIANVLGSLAEMGDPSNIGRFVRQTMDDAEKLRSTKQELLVNELKDKMNKLGRYGDIPDDGGIGDIIMDARKVRDQHEKSLYKVLDPYMQEPADLMTLRNKADALTKEASEYGSYPLGKTTQKIVDDILNPPAGAKDTLEALRRFQSRLSKTMRNLPEEDRIDMSRLQQLKVALDQGFENTINGMALQDDNFYEQLLKKREEIFSSMQRQDSAARMQGDAKSGGVVFSSDAGAASKAGTGRESFARNQELPSDSAPTKLSQRQLDDTKAAKQFTFEKYVLEDLENKGLITKLGTIDEKRFDKWINNTKTKEMLQRSPEFYGRIKDAKSAQSFLDDYNARATDEMQKFKLTELYKYAGENVDPVGIVGQTISSNTKDSAKVFADLVRKVKKSQDALDALRAATGEQLRRVGRVVDIGESTSKVGSPDKLAQVIENNKEALKIIYGGGQNLNQLEAIAAEIRRGQTFGRMSSVKGGSDTAANLAYSQRMMKKPSLYSYVSGLLGKGAGAIGAFVGSHTMGPQGAAAGAVVGENVTNLLNKLKSNKVQTIDELQLKMFTDPEFAKTMLQRYSGSAPTNSILGNVTKTLPPIVAVGAISSHLPSRKGEKAEQ